MKPNVNDAIDEEPITERLRGVPLEKWKREDFDEEIAARRKRAAEYMQKADTAKWMMDVFAPLQAKFPEAPIATLVDLLPEPERSIARDIVHAPVKWSDLPIQRTNRKPWHETLEKTIIARANAGWNFTTGELLAEAMVPHAALAKARRYAEEILFSAGGRQIEDVR